MAGPTSMHCSRTYPLTVEQAFDGLLPLPLEALFDRRYGPIPRITSVDGPADPPWATVGQTRTIRLADGGGMREELTRVERPHTFGYVLTGISGPMAPLAERVEGLWEFEPAGTGARITWSWVVHPKPPLGRFALPAFARLWRGYAARGLQRIEELLVTS